MNANKMVRYFGAVAIMMLVLASSVQAHFVWRPIDTMTITDMKAAGRAFPIPTAEHPIYYVGVNIGLDWPGGYCPPGEAIPSSKTMQDTVVRALARNHYLSADATHPPSQIILMAWGYLEDYSQRLSYYSAVRVLAGDKYMDGGDPSEEMHPSMGFTIPHRLIPALSQAKLHDYAASLCYYADIRAYAAKDALKQRAVSLWETRIACPANGLAMDSTLPTMIKLAAPHIGIETKKEFFTTPEKSMREDIQTGELHVVDDVDVDAAQIVPLKALLAPSPKDQKKASSPEKSGK